MKSYLNYKEQNLLILSFVKSRVEGDLMEVLKNISQWLVQLGITVKYKLWK